jgi:hypothetical protein
VRDIAHADLTGRIGLMPPVSRERVNEIKD